MRVARAVCVDRLDPRCRYRCDAIGGVHCRLCGHADIGALCACAHENGAMQQAEHRARGLARLVAQVVDARIPSLLTNLLGLPMVHRHDDPVGGQSVRDADHGGDVQDDTHTLGQGAQRCFCGLPVQWVIHEVTVDVEHIMRGHGSRKVRPRACGCHRLGSLCGDEGTFGSAVDQSNAEAVVHPLHSGTGIDDSFAREGLLDQ